MLLQVGKFVAVATLFVAGASCWMAAKNQEPEVQAQKTLRASSAATLPARTVRREGELLELQSFRCERSSGYMYITGEVKNISSRPLRSIQAVGTFYTADSEFITSDAKHIEYQPVMPNQVSPFRLSARVNPLFKKCKVDFKEFLGGSVRWCNAGKCRSDSQYATPSQVDIMEAQNFLRLRGHYNGKIDGLSGPATRAAIKAYQAEIGIEPDGRISRSLLRRMKSES